jgi:hypothetical protein
MAPSPPLACVLEERPFGVGGLAERMVSELITGVGYGFELSDDDEGDGDGQSVPLKQVQPIDIGKEISRNPRLDSRSWKYDRIAELRDSSHFMVLEPKGPIGLHFEQPNVPAPAWSNCQYLLKPRTLTVDFCPTSRSSEFACGEF